MCECDRAAELLSRRLDGDELTGPERAFLDGHLADCPECRALASQFDTIHAALPDLEVKPPTYLKDDIMARIAAEERAKKVVAFPARKKSPWKGWAAMAAVFAVVLLGAGPVRDGLTVPTAGGHAAPQGLELDRSGANPVAEGASVLPPETDATPAPRSIDAPAGGDTPTAAPGDGAAGLPLLTTFTQAPTPTPEGKCSGEPSADEREALALAVAACFPEGALPEGWDALCTEEGEQWTVTFTAPDGARQLCRVDLANGSVTLETE